MEMYVKQAFHPQCQTTYGFILHSRLPYSRVAELEQENAALRALTQSGSSPSSHPKKAHSNEELLSEIEQLRAQLEAAGERELELSAELERQAEAQHAAVKIEAAEPRPPSPVARAPIHKPGASLGLMVSRSLH
jgi:hypothetical protein